MGTRRGLPHVSLGIAQHQQDSHRGTSAALARRCRGAAAGGGCTGCGGPGGQPGLWGPALGQEPGAEGAGWVAARGAGDWQDLRGNPGETVPEPPSPLRKAHGCAWCREPWSGGGRALVKGSSFPCGSAAAGEAPCPGSHWGVKSVCGGLGASHAPTAHLQRGVAAAGSPLRGTGPRPAPLGAVGACWGPRTLRTGCWGLSAPGPLHLLFTPVSGKGRAGEAWGGGPGGVSSQRDPPGKGGARAPLLAGCQPAEESVRRGAARGRLRPQWSEAAVDRIKNEWCKVIGAGEASGMVKQGRAHLESTCTNARGITGVTETWQASLWDWSAATGKQAGKVGRGRTCEGAAWTCAEPRSVPGWGRACGAGPEGRPGGLGFVSPLPKQFSTCVSRVTGKRGTSGVLCELIGNTTLEHWAFALKK